jgi:hypothetical protein
MSLCLNSVMNSNLHGWDSLNTEWTTSDLSQCGVNNWTISMILIIRMF